MNKKQKNILTLWLFLGMLTVAIIVLVGGITRLTNSGLSMVEWNLISGSIPPMNDNEWEIAFDKYKQFPEYKKINQDMLLEEFKIIYFWEYLHRILGRILGIIFIIPFLFFIIKRWLTTKQIKQLLLLLILGGVQAFLGWFMVKSGLIDVPAVSHYRLASHLIVAFCIISYIYWLILDTNNTILKSNKNINKWSKFLILILLIQIVSGAFVAGLKAGYLVDPENNLLEKLFGYNSLSQINFLNNGYDLQAFHRLFAWTVFCIAIIIYSKTRRTNLSKIGTIILIITLIQMSLGIATLLLQVPINTAVAHQFTAMILLLSIVHITYVSSETSQSDA